jgi:2-polyprenyl-3-methyl-5-hydroxy-6-metoxy-1,4-benzoquinol methylase
VEIHPENNQQVSREKQLEQTRSHWDKLASEELRRDFTQRSWGSLGSIQRNHNYLVTNDPDYYWIDYVKDKYFKNGNAGHTLSLGCGEGFIERLFKQCGFYFESITGVDLSEKCIETAKQRAHHEMIASKINYLFADLNNYTPSPKSYNFILFFHSLHHIKSLENIMLGCAKALLPNGLLMVNEFVGPSRFQWTDQQIKAANDILNIIPENLRYDLQHHVTKQKIRRPTIDEMISDDASEAVRSADIEKILKRHFDVLEEKNWGGTINNLLFADIAGNFDLQNPYHKALVELLIHHENILIANKILPSDFKFYIAKPKKALYQKLIDLFRPLGNERLRSPQ